MAAKNEFCKYAGKPCRTEIDAELKALEKGMRAYLCESCGTFHLTSQPRFELSQTVEPQEIDLD